MRSFGVKIFLFSIAFANPKTFAKIVGAPVDLVEDMAHLLNTINTPFPIDPQKFDDFAKDWLRRFHASKISWCWLNPSVHVLLQHGKQMIEYFPVPLGLMSEEGTEVKHYFDLLFDFEFLR